MRLGFMRSVLAAVSSLSTSTDIRVVDGRRGVAYAGRRLKASPGKREVWFEPVEAESDYYVVANGRVALCLNGRGMVADVSPRQFLVGEVSPSAHFMPAEWQLEWREAQLPRHYLDSIERRISWAFGADALPYWWTVRPRVMEVAVSDRVYYGHWWDAKRCAGCALYGLVWTVQSVVAQLCSGRVLVARLPDGTIQGEETGAAFEAGELMVIVGDDESNDLMFPSGVLSHDGKLYVAWQLPVREEIKETFISATGDGKVVMLEKGDYAVLIERSAA